MKQEIRFTLFFILFSAITFAQKTYVFIGSYNWDKNVDGIYIYNLNYNNGTLTQVNKIKGIRNPSYLTVKGVYIYSVTDSKTPGAGSVSCLHFNPENGDLKFINSQPSNGENPVYTSVHPNGKWLAEANYTEGSITVYPIKNDGSIGAPAQTIQYTEGSINPNRQEKSHLHSAIFSPDGTYLFSTDLGADKIHSFAFNTNADKPLLKESFTTTPPGSGPRHLIFHPNGKWAYCTEEISGSVSAYLYTNGELESFQRVMAHPEELISEDYETSDIHISPDGRFLYAANRGKQNNIAIFSIDSKGRLKLIGYEPTHGLHPRAFAIDPLGKFLIVANVNSNSATIFRRNAQTGILSYLGSIENLAHITTVQIHTYP